MQSTGLDPKLYKKIEDDINRKLFSETNSLSFIRIAGAVMEEHLNQLTALRKLSEQWLDWMDLPTRDDIAEISKIFIENENRLDCLDETLYMTLMEVKEHKKQMERLVWKVTEISAELDVEMEVDLAEIK